MTCLALLPTCSSVSRMEFFPSRPTSNLVSKNPALFFDSRRNGVRRIDFLSPPSVDVAANRPDHPLHRLDRLFNDSVALRASNSTVLVDHP